MDIQETMMNFLPQPGPLLENVKKAIEAARTRGIPVIFVVLSFKDGYPEIPLDHPRFGPIKQSGDLFTERNQGTALHHSIRYLPGDIIVQKKRVSAFAGSDLQVILSALGAKKLVLSGFATTGVVLSTQRAAADLDYRVLVLSDACADPEPEVHDFLVKKVFPFSGDVMTIEEWKNSSI